MKIVWLTVTAAVFAMALLFAALANGDPAVAQTADTPTPTSEQNDQALDMAAALEGKLNASQYPNMDSNLNQIVEQAQTGQFTVQATAAKAPVYSGASVGVTLYITEGYAQDIWDWLEERGASPRNIGADYIEAYIPVSLLSEASQQEGVLSIRTIIPRQSAQGTVVSEGVAAHAVPAWHTAGYRGQGIKIGIIDDFEGFSSLMGTELPSTVQVRCYTSIGVHSSSRDDCESYGNHGTAVTELVFDIAPEATYYISNAYTRGDLQSAVSWMVEQDVDVINLSSSWLWDGPGDGTSRFSDSPLKTVDTAIANGIIFVNSVGNHAEGTWFGNSNREPFDPRYRFRFQYFDGNDVTNCMRLDIGEALAVQLRWDDTWDGAVRDLNLALFRGLTLVASSFDVQSGLSSHIPFESLIYSATIGGTYCLIVSHENSNPSVPSWIQLQAHSLQSLEHYTLHHSIVSPAESANPGLLAVGAAPWDDISTIEDFSSQGPTPDDRIKPDIAGADGGRTTLRPDGFYGTSASSAHVAGLAALVKQRFPEKNPEQVAQYLKDYAEARGAVPNNTWGYGFAKLPASDVATPTPEPTATSEPTPGPTGSPQPTPDPSATAEPTPEPTATPEPTPQPTATPEPTPPPSSAYNIEDHACNADDLAHLDGYTLDSTFGPESYEADYTGVIGYYRSRFVADNAPTIVCFGTQYDTIANARWDSLNYSTVLQYAATAVDEIFDHEQAFVSSYIGEDTLGLLLDYEIDDSSFKSSEVIFLDAATLTVTTVRAIQSDSDDYPDISIADGISRNIAARVIPDDTATQSSSSLLKLFGWLE